MELSNSEIKKVSYIFSKESFYYLSRNGTSHFLSPSSKNKEVYPVKIAYILEKGNILYFLKRKLFLYFRKRKPEKILYI